MLTWANFGEGFVTEQCMGCHASTTQERFGAPAEVVLDDVDDVWALRDDILAVSVGDGATMPPGSPAPEEEQEKLRLWLTCAEEGT